MGGSGQRRVLRILHVDPEKNWGGGEAQVLGLLTFLASRGHHNDLYAHPGGILSARCQGLAIRIYPLTMRNDLDVRSVMRIRRLIRATGYDIVHFHTKRAHALSPWLPHGAGAPKYVVTRRMDYPEPRSWYTDLLYNRSVDGVVAISQTIAQLLISAGVEPKKIRCVRSGIELQRFASIEPRPSKAGDPFVVGCLAALEERKGHRDLLHAAALLKRRGLRVQVRIAGDGPLLSRLKNDAARLQLDNEVKFFGFVTDAVAFLRDVDSIALPSLYEGLGVAVLEGMAAGKPVVATRVGGVTESVLDGVTGMLVPARDPEALAAAIARLAELPHLARSLGAKGRERVRECFSIEQMARGNESFYYELAGSARVTSG